MGFFKPNLDKYDVILRFFVPYENDYYTEKIQKIRAILEDYEEKKVFLDIVSLLQNPRKAKEFGVYSTPCLMRSKPEPNQYYVGVFHNHEMLKEALNSLFKEKQES